MNYYEHHIRDYDAATAHLTWDQDMAYSRLLRWYYRKEQPVPADIAEACRQVRATSKPQREAVESVLKEFFVLRDDGWHQDTCDEAISTFKAGEPEREAKKKNEDTRLARHRAERAELFGVINEAGIHMAWNCPIAELRATAERIKNGPATPPATPPATAETHAATPPATGTATPATATQAPDTNHQTPVDKKNTPLPPKGGFEVPDWIPAKPWADFVAMRRAKGQKTPFTVAAAKGIVAKLETFRASGIDIEAVLAESVINGWSSVYEPKTAHQGRSSASAPNWTEAAT